MRFVKLLTLAAAIALADRFPEAAKDSQPILDEQYRQMDAYFQKLAQEGAAKRARYWNRLELSSPAAFDRSAESYRKDWADFLRVPYQRDLALNVKTVKVREFPTYTAYRVWF